MKGKTAMSITETSVAQVVDLRSLSSETRKFARDHNVYVGERGSVPRPLLEWYLNAVPQRARQEARKIGFDLPDRGRIAAGKIEELVDRLLAHR
jgi:hypothetical protein